MPRFSVESSVTSSSPKKILPLEGFCRPRIMYSVVLLPQPDGPSRPINLPSGISKLKLLTATTSSLLFLLRLGKILVRFCRTIFIRDPFLLCRWGIELIHQRAPIAGRRIGTGRVWRVECGEWSLFVFTLLECLISWGKGGITPHSTLHTPLSLFPSTSG